jgi:hypothetical protein
MHRDRRVDQVAPKRAKPSQRAVFIRTGKSAKADHICGQDSREFPVLAHSAQRLLSTLAQ